MLKGLVEGLTPSDSHWLCLVSCYSSWFFWAISVLRCWDQLARRVSCRLQKSNSRCSKVEGSAAVSGVLPKGREDREGPKVSMHVAAGDAKVGYAAGENGDMDDLEDSRGSGSHGLCHPQSVAIGW